MNLKTGIKFHMSGSRGLLCCLCHARGRGWLYTRSINCLPIVIFIRVQFKDINNNVILRERCRTKNAFSSPCSQWIFKQQNSPQAELKYYYQDLTATFSAFRVCFWFQKCKEPINEMVVSLKLKKGEILHILRFNLPSIYFVRFILPHFKQCVALSCFMLCTSQINIFNFFTHEKHKTFLNLCAVYITIRLWL